MYARKNDRRLPSPLQRGAKRFAEWRRSHELGTRIPDALSNLAANLASTFGISRTACTLKLDYYALKRRVTEQTPLTLAAPSNAVPAFLELPASTLAASSECFLELENSTGAKMRVHLKGVTPDLVALTRSFCGGE
jgi:hypothetical protein